MKKLLTIITLSVLLFSCKVQLMPVYNQSMINQITAAKFTVDSVYDVIIQGCDSPPTAKHFIKKLPATKLGGIMIATNPPQYIDNTLIVDTNKIYFYNPFNTDSYLYTTAEYHAPDITHNYYGDCRDFANFKSGYELSEIYINNIITSEAARPKAKILADQAQRIKNVFENSYNYHAKNIVISAQTAFGFKTQIDATFDALMVSETNLNK